jgi:hypothetical protein
MISAGGVSAHAKTADEPRVVIKGQSPAKNDDPSGVFANQRIARGTEQVHLPRGQSLWAYKSACIVLH